MPKWAHGLCYALLGVMFLGCYPPLDRYQVVQEGTDAGPPGMPPPGTDAGPPTAIDLGTPCGNPHLLVATMGNTSDTARLLRWDPATNGYCRAVPALEQQEGFGFRVRDVDWSAETHDVLGLENAVLGLDTQGFQAWRYQPFDESSFGGSVVSVLNTGSGMRIAAFWAERSSSSYEYGRLVDSTGNVRNERFELPFGAGRMAAAHPAGDGRLLLANLGGPIEVYTVNDATEQLREADSTELFVGSDMLESTFGVGNRQWIGADITSGRVAITHQTGAFLWSNGQGAPTTVFDCSALCERLAVGVPGPGEEIYAICDGGPADHLVHMTSGSCSMLIDGTSLGTFDLLDVALVREAR